VLPGRFWAVIAGIVFRCGRDSGSFIVIVF
jgi:hypothetical protein